MSVVLVVVDEVLVVGDSNNIKVTIKQALKDEQLW